ncbi:MAG: DUF922 domain-containing protein [Bacteroidia bacterium]
MLYLLFQPLIALFLTFNSGPDLPDRTHLIVWDQSRTLLFDDFKSAGGPKGKEAALAVVGMEYSASMTSKLYQVSIVTMFDTQKSWFSKEEIGNDFVLKHEQGHFDIAEIHARRLRKTIALSKFNNKNVFDKVSAMYKEANKKLHQDQQLYDKETDHSIKFENQLTWNEKILLELLSLEEYKDTLMIVKF